MGSLTEKQVNEMTAVATDGVDIDPEVEKAWLDNELKQAEKNLQQAVLTFKYHKAMGHHEAMETTSAAVANLKHSIEYFKEQIKGK